MGAMKLTWKGTDLTTKLKGLRILDVKVNRRYKTPENTLEDGTPVIDHKVRLPIEVTVMCCLGSEGDKGLVMSGLMDMCDSPLGEKKVAAVTDRTGYEYGNLVLIDYGHNDNNSDKFDNLYFDLKFKEVMFMGGESVKEAQDSENTDTEEGGVEVDI